MNFLEFFFAKCLSDVKTAALGLVCYGLTFWAREHKFNLRNGLFNELNAIRKKKNKNKIQFLFDDLMTND